MIEARPWTVRNLREIDDAAAGHGYGESQEARFASKDLGAARTGLSLQRIKPDRSSAFAHRHRDAEEIYVVLSGGGQARLDGETIELRPFDAVRVAPHVVRSFAAGPDGLELLALGAAHPGDAELVPAG